MMEFAALTYGLLASVILSAAQRNRKLARPHPPLLLYLGYLLCGVSAGIALVLAYVALTLIAGGFAASFSDPLAILPARPILRRESEYR